MKKALLAAALVIVLFMAAVWHWQAAPAVSGLFVGCLGCVGMSLIYFLRDQQRSLHALALELDLDSRKRRRTPPPAPPSS